MVVLIKVFFWYSKVKCQLTRVCFLEIKNVCNSRKYFFWYSKVRCQFTLKLIFLIKLRLIIYESSLPFFVKMVDLRILYSIHKYFLVSK